MKHFLSRIDSFIRKSKFKNEINEITEKYNIDSKLLKEHIKNMKIYIDFDDVIAELIPSWLDYIKNTTVNEISKEDITYFQIFNDIPGALGFLDDFFLYHSKEDAKKIDPSYEREFRDITIKKDAIKFFEILKQNDLIKNLVIVTASAPKTHWSKSEFISKNLPFLDVRSQFVTTGDKSLLDFTKQFSIMIDDAEHNVLKVVENNDLAISILINDNHNQDIKTYENNGGSRIFRIDRLDSDDFFDKLLYAAVKNLAKTIDKSISYDILQPHLNEYLKENKDIKPEIKKTKSLYIEEDFGR